MKKVALVIIIIIMCMIFFDIPYYDKNFKYEYDCIKFIVGENETENLTVTLKGKISKYLFNKEKIIRYTLQIGDDYYPIRGENVAIYPYEPRSESTKSLYIGNRLSYKPTDKIETELNYRESNYEVRIGYNYVDTNTMKFIIEHNGWIDITEDFSKICIGLFPDEGYTPKEFPKGIIAVVSASTYSDGNQIINEFWRNIR